ncbi:MAG: plastocyanin [Scytolyngbya sp. HA4215-MV1]|jgi:plastocyanin|nr:plastocyanin [Scytolyngbya sp. HA4215-MV1]
MSLITSVLRKVGLAMVAVALLVSTFAVSVPTAMAETYTVKMGANNGMLQFEPAKLAIKPGDTVEWVINKVPPHNVVFDDKAIPGQDKAFAKSLSHQQLLMGPSEKVSTTFPADAAPGEYTYFCAPHRSAGMMGKIIVGG